VEVSIPDRARTSGKRPWKAGVRVRCTRLGNGVLYEESPMDLINPTHTASNATHKRLANSEPASQSSLHSPHVCRALNFVNLLGCELVGMIVLSVMQLANPKHCGAAVFWAQSSLVSAVNHVVASGAPKDVRRTHAQFVVASVARLKTFMPLFLSLNQQEVMSRNISGTVPKLAITGAGCGASPYPTSRRIFSDLRQESFSSIHCVKFMLSVFRSQEQTSRQRAEAFLRCKGLWREG
jgi:hypothetical protein